MRSADGAPGGMTAGFTTLFVDIGGVLLTDGWAQPSRQAAAAAFALDAQELEARHHQAFAAYETGRLTLEDYLGHVVFHRKRDFSRHEFQAFMFAQSRAHPEMIALVRALKAGRGLKVVVVSNEGRELNSHRISTFGLDACVDIFVSSCFVHLRKPDPEIFRLALDLAQAAAPQVVYIENTPMFTEVATGLGIRSILHKDPAATRAELDALGLTGLP